MFEIFWIDSVYTVGIFMYKYANAMFSAFCFSMLAVILNNAYIFIFPIFDDVDEMKWNILIMAKVEIVKPKPIYCITINDRMEPNLDAFERI